VFFFIIFAKSIKHVLLESRYKEMKKALKLHPKDNVLVALVNLEKKTKVSFEGDFYSLVSEVPAKHKFAIEYLCMNAEIWMYGVLVGKAIKPIKKGELVSTENCAHEASSYKVDEIDRDLNWNAPNINEWKDKKFLGYHREDGSVGTANVWIVIPLVFCENRNILAIKKALEERLGYNNSQSYGLDIDSLIDGYIQGKSKEEILKEDILIPKGKEIEKRLFKNVDGLKFITQNIGCGETRQDSQALCNLIAGYITNPNVAGATILSLGCQNAQESILLEAVKKRMPNYDRPIYILEQQKSTSESQFIAEAVKKTFAGMMEANKNTRKPASLNKLVVGLECGGSDGFSGISANPVLGYCSDLLVALKAATILAEFPELNGVEQELINRCKTKEAAEKFAGLMETYNKRAIESGSGFHANPSPGNIKDGLITDAMKSAGAAKKGGTSPITQVLDYTEKVTEKGLCLLCTPGNDVESTTGIAASGANLILFSTGLGTPTGNPVVPVIKVATNSELSKRMGDIIDFNAGEVIEGTKTIEESGASLLDFIIEVASGNVQTKSMLLGQDDFIPWRRGISL